MKLIISPAREERVIRLGLWERERNRETEKEKKREEESKAEKDTSSGV